MKNTSEKQTQNKRKTKNMSKKQTKNKRKNIRLFFATNGKNQRQYLF